MQNNTFIPTYSDEQLNAQTTITPLLSRSLPEFAVLDRSILLFDFHWVLNNQSAKQNHTHRFLEIHVPYTGTYKLHTMEGTANFAPGQVAIIPSGLPHTWGTIKAPTRMHIWWMLLADGGRPQESGDEPSMIDALFSAKDLVYKVPENYFHLLDALLAELSKPERGAVEILRSIMLQLIVSFARSVSLPANIRVNLKKSRKRAEKLTDRMLISRVDEFIQSNLMYQITIDEIADHMRMSPSTLMHRYAAKRGRSIWKTVSEMRMERAKALLLNSDFSVGEIARRCGIPDKHYFSNKFKAWSGVTPRELQASRK